MIQTYFFLPVVEILNLKSSILNLKSIAWPRTIRTKKSEIRKRKSSIIPKFRDRHFISCLLLPAYCLLFNAATAQDYPVQITTTLTPPYSIYLSDYASPDRPALQVIIHLKELDRPEYKVKLRVTIEGQGITLRTKPGNLPRPLVLQGGLPEILTGDEIRNYLNPENLSP